jgi:hypothetical protein
MTKNWGSNGYSLEAGKYINLGTLDMRQVVATANHDYDHGVLTGTQLTITLPEVDKNKTIVSTNFVVKKGNAAVTGWDAINAPGLRYAKPSSYPYLPQGTYKISGTYTTDKGVTYSISESEFVVGAPFSSGDQLGVTHKVYTSYTYYSEGDVSTANDCKPLVIYNKSVVANISPSILNNSAYNNLKSLKTNSTEGDLTVNAYGEHTVSSTFTFEGVTSTASGLTCYITGLPYQLDTNNSSGWTINQRKETTDLGWLGKYDYYYYGNYKFSNESIRLGYNSDFITNAGENVEGGTLKVFKDDHAELTRVLYIPEGKSAQVEFNCSGMNRTNQYDHDSSWLKVDYWYYGNTSTITVGSETKEHKLLEEDSGLTNGDYAREIDFNLDGETELTNSNSSIVLGNSNSKESCATYIYTLTILYK